eukprot:g95.t1
MSNYYYEPQGESRSFDNFHYSNVENHEGIYERQDPLRASNDQGNFQQITPVEPLWAAGSGNSRSRVTARQIAREIPRWPFLLESFLTIVFAVVLWLGDFLKWEENQHPHNGSSPSNSSNRIVDQSFWLTDSFGHIVLVKTAIMFLILIANIASIQYLRRFRDSGYLLFYRSFIFLKRAPFLIPSVGNMMILLAYGTFELILVPDATFFLNVTQQRHLHTDLAITCKIIATMEAIVMSYTTVAVINRLARFYKANPLNDAEQFMNMASRTHSANDFSDSLGHQAEVIRCLKLQVQNLSEKVLVLAAENKKRLHENEYLRNNNSASMMKGNNNSPGNEIVGPSVQMHNVVQENQGTIYS